MNTVAILYNMRNSCLTYCRAITNTAHDDPNSHLNYTSVTHLSTLTKVNPNSISLSCLSISSPFNLEQSKTPNKEIKKKLIENTGIHIGINYLISAENFNFDILLVLCAHCYRLPALWGMEIGALEMYQCH